jgi:23S rRNA pseudouridine2605 synthase/23S rRNA pseudouridine2604 synthase
MDLMRLQKFLSTAGVCSRRKGEEYIQKGFVSVNDKVADQPGIKIDPSKDCVKFNGKVVNIENKLIYIALNKPSGYITSCKHNNEKIVMDLLDIDERVYPVGRLDKKSDGLLLLTNDGTLHHRLSHPSFDHEKQYRVSTLKEIDAQSLKKMAEGILLDDKITRPARVKRVSGNSFEIVLKEGRNRQIRRMVDTFDNRVLELTRLRISNIKLGDLKKGHFRYLSEKEIAKLTKFND